MTTTITYKGETLTTVTNTTKTMTTAGKYLEDDVTITDTTASATLQTKSKSYTPTESAQSETVSADVGYDGLEEVNVSVGAISSTYVGTGITRRDSTDLSSSGPTVTAPAGYYESNASATVTTMTLPTTVSSGHSGTKAADISYSVGSGSKYLTIPEGYNTSKQYYQLAQVPQGSEGTPTATKGTVSSNQVSVTPAVNNSAGFITGGTKTGTAVTVSASELVSGTKSITANDTGIDVTNYAAVDVAVPASTPTLQTKTKTYTPSTSSQSDTITPDVGYDGLDEVDVTVSAMPTGSATPPEVVDLGASITAGTNTITLSKIMSLTPTVSPGYISAGTAANRNVVLTASANVKGATTYTPTTADQTISSGTYLTGAQTISGDANLVAGNIKSGTTIFGVTGTYGGGGTTLKDFVIRPDAVLVQTWSDDKLAIHDSGITKPSYSTTAQTIKTFTSDTVTIDRNNYEYMLIYRCITYPIYTSGTNKGAGRHDYTCYLTAYEISRSPSVVKSLDGTKTWTTAINRVSVALTNGITGYWSSATSFKAASYQNYGCYQTVSTNPSATDTALTVTQPTWYMRGSTTYLNSTYWNAISDIRYQKKIELYRVPIPSTLNTTGWTQYQTLCHLVDDINTNGGTLT